MKQKYLLLFAMGLIMVGCSGGEKPAAGTDLDVSNKGISGTVDGKKVDLNTNQVTEADLGFPIYPGSEPTDRDMKVEAGTEKSYVSTRTTADSPEKVLEYYKGLKLDPKGTAVMSGQMALASGTLSNGRKFAVSAMVKDGKTEVVASSGPGS